MSDPNYYRKPTPPYKRDPEGRRHEPDMALPDGKTCQDCVHFLRCRWLVSAHALNEVCDWSPSRFRPRVVKFEGQRQE